MARSGKALLLGVYVLLLCELFMWVFKPMPLMPRYVADSGYGVRGNAPGAEYSHYSREYGTIDFRINQKGVRSSREISYEKPAGVFRILSLGDSFAAGYGAQEAQTYVGVMEGYLASQYGCPAEVVNLGVSGFGTAEELVTLRREGMKYQPDLVLVSWHETDTSENVRSELFSLDQTGQLQTLNEEYLPAVKLRQRLFSYGPYRFIASKSMLYTWIRDQVAFATKRLLSDRVEARVAIHVSQEASSDQRARTKKNRKTRKAAQAQLSVALLRELAATASRGGAGIQFLNIPTRKSRDQFTSSFPAKTGLEEYVYDPRDDFARYQGEILFWERTAGHFSVLGNKIVGEGLADAIQSRCSRVGNEADANGSEQP